MAEPVASAEMNDEEKAAFAAARQTTADFAARIGQKGFDTPVSELVADDDQRVMVTVPSDFVLTLDDHRRTRFFRGANYVPVKSLGVEVASHPYIALQGGKSFAAPDPSRAALGATELPDPVPFGDKQIPLKDFVKEAQSKSGLSIAEWNKLTEAKRQEAIENIIDGHRAEAGHKTKN